MDRESRERAQAEYRYTLWWASVSDNSDDIVALEAALRVEGVSVNATTHGVPAPLLRSAERGCLAAFRALLAAGADAAALHEGQSVVALAMMGGNAAVIREAVAVAEAAAPLLSPLHLAACAEDGGEAVAAALSGAATAEERGGLVAATAPERHGGGTALHFASACGNVGAVMALLAAGSAVVVHTVATDGATPLMVAAAGGHVEVVKRLRAAGARVRKDPRWESLLCKAMRHGSSAKMDALVAAGAADVTSTDAGTSVLRDAVEAGKAAPVKWLLDAGFKIYLEDKDSELSTPLMTAVDQRNLEIVTLLLAAGCRVNAHERWTKYFSTWSDRLLGPYANFDAGSSPLRIAAEIGHVAIVEVLLAAGADVNEVDVHRLATPLRIAVEKGHAGVVRALLAAGADANEQRSKRDASLLTLAAGQRHMDVMLALLDAGADVDGSFVTSPLHCAACRYDGRFTASLLGAGAKVDMRGEDRNHANVTPLWVAANRCNLDAVRLLLAAGADPRATSAEGYSVLQVVGWGAGGHAAALKGHVRWEVVWALAWQRRCAVVVGAWLA